MRNIAGLLMLWLAFTPALGQDIVVGQTVALTGGPSEHGKAVLQGAQAYLAQVNAAGGIGGRRIVLQTLDDGGDARRAAANTARAAGNDGGSSVEFHAGASLRAAQWSTSG